MYMHIYINVNQIRSQPIDGNVLGELEQMEKELDIEDILRYRSSAECRLQVS